MKLLNEIAKVAAPNDATQSYPDSDQIIVAIRKPKPGFLGLIYDGAALMVDYKSAMSFRVQEGNLGLHKHLEMFRSELQFPKEQLSKFFEANRDNPYALEYVIGRMTKRYDVTTELTQVPPIVTHYRNKEERQSALQRLIKSAQPMDSVFSRPIQPSKVSALIRSVDRCQFSHVGTYLGDGITVDASPSGVNRNHLSDIGTNSHLGLYRLRQPISDDQKVKAIEFYESQIGGKYNWPGVIEVYLRQILKLSINQNKPSVSDVLFSENFQLIDFV